MYLAISKTNDRMKKLALLMLATFAISSCSSDDGDEAEFVMIPIESVMMPASYRVDSTSIIQVNYRRPTDCHFFNNFYVQSAANTQVIAIQSVILSHDNCAPDPDHVFEVPLEFTPEAAGEYIFRFWTGDVDGLPQYAEYEVVVF
jgi:hypothetical protein